MDESAFDPGTWAGRLGTIRALVRQRLVSDQLRAHLPAPRAGQVVVDVGCGQGTQVFILAERGYSVLGIDPSNDLLALARRGLADQPPAVRARIQFRTGDLESLGDIVDHPADIVLCHGVVMYLPSLADSVARLAQHVADGGILSTLTRNQAGIAMRAGMERRWDEVPDGFTARTYTNNLGTRNVRAHSPAEVVAEYRAQGLEVLAWYGVRLFTDHWDTEEAEENLAALIEAERQAGERDPYRQLTALTHVIARKPA